MRSRRAGGQGRGVPQTARPGHSRRFRPRFPSTFVASRLAEAGVSQYTVKAIPTPSIPDKETRP